MYHENDYEVIKRRLEDLYNKEGNSAKMVIVKSENAEDEFLPMENVPKLPPISRPVEYQYSENPYEVDLSFRSLDVIAFQDTRRGGSHLNAFFKALIFYILSMPIVFHVSCFNFRYIYSAKKVLHRWVFG